MPATGPEMDVTSESLSSAQTRSVVLKLFQDVGSAHPTTWYRSFTYDIARGKPVTFDSLFARTPSLWTRSSRSMQRTRDRNRFGRKHFPGDSRDSTHYQNFAVTDDSVIFYFRPGELLPSYAGETSVTVPRSALPLQN